MSETLLVEAAGLERYVAALFESAGMSPEQATEFAGALVQTNLWGVDSHGVLRVPIYLERLRSGAMNPRPKPVRVRGTDAFEVIDGDAGPGVIVARTAMRRAVAAAHTSGVGLCGVVNSNHFGAAGLYARLAAADGMIGIAMTNVMPNIIAPGGSRPVTGNNPLAVAAPTGGPFPFVLDISLSAVAGGKLLLASKKGERIPLDWATDAEGRPTDDPDVAFAGFLLPLGGFKGLGLSYVVDVLCGVLTGGAFGWGVKSMYAQREDPSLTGHLLMAVDVAALMDPDEFNDRMDRYCAGIKASPMWEEGGEMLVPGELEYRSEQQRLAEGIPLPQELYRELRELGSAAGLTLGLEPTAASGSAADGDRA